MQQQLEFIYERQSIRRYLKRKVADDAIDSILTAATLAPTARNIQPWLISAVTDPDILALIGNMADHGRFIKDAPLCFAVFCEKEEKYFLEDGCAATMNIILSAQALGLGTCWVAGDKKHYCQDISTLLNVPKTHSLISLIACGYPGEEPTKKTKKPVKKTCFTNRYESGELSPYTPD